MLTFPLSRQRGAFSILAAGTLMMALGCLMLVLDTGRLYMEQRKLQKLADTAALEAVARMSSDPDGYTYCGEKPGKADSYAKLNVSHNDKTIDTDKASIKCVDIKNENGIRVVDEEGTEGLATQVTLFNEVPTSLIFRAGSLFNNNISATTTLKAQAIAMQESEATAVFSVGAELLRLDNSRLLGILLKSVGLNVDHLSVLNSEGLASASVTPSGLLKELGVELSINQLRALSPTGLVELEETNVSLLKMIEALQLSADVVKQNEVVALSVNILELLGSSAQLEQITLNLFCLTESNDENDCSSNPGVIALAAGQGAIGSALDAQINLIDLITTSLAIGTQKRGLLLGYDGSANLSEFEPEYVKGVNLLGLIKLQAGIVEPPSIGIGPVGTKARNSQIRLFADVNTGDALDTLLGIRVKLPIAIDLVSATGTLKAINCSAPTPTATIEVDSKIGGICIGKFDNYNLWSTSESCEDKGIIQDETLIKIKPPILSKLTGSISITDSITLDISHASSERLTLQEGESDYTQSNNLYFGATIKNLLNEVLNLFSSPENYDRNMLKEECGILGLGCLLTGVLSALLNALSDIITPLISSLVSPLLDLVGNVLSSILEGLGIDLSTTDVVLHSISCGAPPILIN
ncbi:pilus assembly protein TadG-related protein [Zobellella iuensis]|uniref:Putative Flp pilus-assembly TadG-like N-terminal domain-containing protein n=1 Tax=Zobellella iuensis TaxID=2803811 RepID=A0ABS1QPB3_9GAMM|nr:pilus assembly protein TadG-related protein [Zobellella iuensis]MBL1376611.1 hypothetical protein [Zobellella iuensis]